jgi:heme-degrading monooxygenase HmoA
MAPEHHRGENIMLVERSEIIVREGAEAAFATAMKATGVPLLEATEGVVAVSFGQGVENPAKFILMVEWASMDAHVAFTQAPTFPDLRAVFAPYSTGGAMEHFLMQ